MVFFLSLGMWRVGLDWLLPGSGSRWERWGWMGMGGGKGWMCLSGFAWAV